MSKIKPGDWVMVEVFSVESPAEISVKNGNRHVAVLHTAAIRPIPAPDPLAELKKQVVEAAVATYTAEMGEGVTEKEVRYERNAVRALIAAQTPPNPVKELREAWGAYSRYGGAQQITRLEAAIAAIEKAQQP